MEEAKAIIDHKKVAYRRAASLAALQTSGYSVLFFWMTSRVASIIDLE